MPPSTTTGYLERTLHSPITHLTFFVSILTFYFLFFHHSPQSTLIHSQYLYIHDLHTPNGRGRQAALMVPAPDKIAVDSVANGHVRLEHLASKSAPPAAFIAEKSPISLTSSVGGAPAFGSAANPFIIDLFLVLGSGRSGTSFTTRSLSVFNIRLRDTVPLHSGSNAKGFFEDSALVKLNDDLLSDLGFRSSFGEIQRDGKAQQIKNLTRVERSLLHFIEVLQQETQTRLAELLNNRKAVKKSSSKEVLCLPNVHEDECVILRMGMKDPRVTRLLPFWNFVLAKIETDIVTEALKSSGLHFRIRPNYIAAVRHPVSVFNSWIRANPTLANRGRDIFQLWQISYLSVILESPPERRFLVHYERFLEQPKVTLEQLGAFVGVPMSTVPIENVETFVNGFLSKKLSHHKAGEKELAEAAKKHHQVKIEEFYSALLIGDEALNRLNFTQQPYSGFHIHLDFSNIPSGLFTLTYAEKLQAFVTSVQKFVGRNEWRPRAGDEKMTDLQHYQREESESAEDAEADVVNGKEAEVEESKEVYD